MGGCIGDGGGGGGVALAAVSLAERWCLRLEAEACFLRQNSSDALIYR